MSKVFVFGVDGGSYQIINSFIQQGFLPNFTKLFREGASGKFISTIPPHTAPGWVSISTGVYPGTHGVYQFWKTQGKDYIGDYQGAKDWKVPPIWKIFNDYSFKTGVINVPMTHPPTELDGFMISWPLSQTLNYCYPHNLLSEIAKAGGHFYPDIYVMYENQEDYLRKACEITKKRTNTIQYLMKNKEWDFFMTVFPEVDRICHFYWNYFDQNSPYYKENSELKDSILQMYIEVDKAMGQIVNSLPADTLFVSLSDHGFRLGKINFNIDSFLVQKGYMTLKECVTENGKTKQDVSSSDRDWFHTCYDGKNYEVDWKKTKIFISAPGSYGINFNLVGRQQEGIVRENEKQELFISLKNDLMEVRNPYKDAPLFKDVVMRESVYKGKCQELAPDIILIPEEYGIMISHHLVLGEIFSEPEQKGMHCREGYILFYGNGIQAGKELEPSEVVDFVPTILHYLGMEIPEYIEGKIIDTFDEIKQSKKMVSKRTRDEVFVDGKKEDSYAKSEKKEIEQRLKNLGYL